jgi:hypothetical protein
MTGPRNTAKFELIKWDDYRDALLNGKGPTWDLLMRSDIVVGGVGLEADFLQVLFIQIL